MRKKFHILIFKFYKIHTIYNRFSVTNDLYICNFFSLLYFILTEYPVYKKGKVQFNNT